MFDKRIKAFLLRDRWRPGAGARMASWAPMKDRKIIGKDVQKVEFGWPLGLPVCRPLGRKLWEVRSDLMGGRIARVIFCVEGERMILLHGFIKKAQKTPQKDLETALERMKR